MVQCVSYLIYIHNCRKHLTTPTQPSNTPLYSCPHSKKTIKPGGGGVLPIIAYTVMLCLKGAPFSGFTYMKGYRNLSFSSVKRPRRAIRCIFLVVKKLIKHSGFLIYLYFKDSEF